MSNNPRTTIRALLTENLKFISENLSDVFERTAQDLVAVGIPHQDVANAVLAVAVAQQMAVVKNTAIIEVLRDTADHIEHELMLKTSRPN